MTETLVRHAAYDFAIPKEMFDDIEKLRADSARLQAENEALRRERDEALDALSESDKSRNREFDRACRESTAREAAEAKAARLREAIHAVQDATAAYLPPDGIDAQECLNRILQATDNPTINAITLGAQYGRP